MLTEEAFETEEGRRAYLRGPAAGPPVLFLHGVVRCGRDYLPLLPAFTGSREVFALDFRGHGASDRTPGAYRVIDYARDAAAFLRTQVSEPAVVYGHSLGAMVACAAAAAVPERVASLVLEDPPFETLGPAIAGTAFHAQFQGMHRVATTAERTVSAFARELAEIRLPAAGGGVVRMGDVRDGTQLRFTAKCLLRMDPDVLEPLIEGRWLEGYEEETILAGVQCPALLLVGDTAKGGMLPDAGAGRVMGQLAEAVRVDVPGAGHLLHWTHTADVVRLALAFVEAA